MEKFLGMGYATSIQVGEDKMISVHTFPNKSCCLTVRNEETNDMIIQYLTKEEKELLIKVLEKE